MNNYERTNKLQQAVKRLREQLSSKSITSDKFRGHCEAIEKLADYYGIAHDDIY